MGAGMPPPAFFPGVPPPGGMPMGGGPPTRAYYPSMDPTAMGTVRAAPGEEKGAAGGGEKR